MIQSLYGSFKNMVSGKKTESAQNTQKKAPSAGGEQNGKFPENSETCKKNFVKTMVQQKQKIDAFVGKSVQNQHPASAAAWETIENIDNSRKDPQENKKILGYALDLNDLAELNRLRKSPAPRTLETAGKIRDAKTQNLQNLATAAIFNDSLSSFLYKAEGASRTEMTEKEKTYTQNAEKASEELRAILKKSPAGQSALLYPPVNVGMGIMEMGAKYLDKGAFVNARIDERAQRENKGIKAAVAGEIHNAADSLALQSPAAGNKAARQTIVTALHFAANMLQAKEAVNETVEKLRGEVDLHYGNFTEKNESGAARVLGDTAMTAANWNYNNLKTALNFNAADMVAVGADAADMEMDLLFGGASHMAKSLANSKL